MKMKLGKTDATPGSSNNNISFSKKRASLVESRKSKYSSCNTKCGIASNAFREENIYKENNDIGVGETIEGRPTKYLRVTTTTIKQDLVEVNLHNEEESSSRDDCRHQDQGLSPSNKSDKKVEDLPHDKESSTVEHPASSSRPWNALPVAFIASQEARERRLHKIHMAKIRINQHRNLLSKKYGIPHMVVAPLSPPHVQRMPGSDEKLSDGICLAPDDEDLRIEKLLLKGACGAELETGYYKALEARFLSEVEAEESSEITENDLIEYLHTSCEVDFLKELNKHRLDSNPDEQDDP